MAEYEERSLDDLTEEPSQSRIDDLRSKGQVVQSKELTATIVFLGLIGSIYFLSGKFIAEFSGLMKDIFSKDLATKIDATNYSAFVEV